MLQFWTGIIREKISMKNKMCTLLCVKSLVGVRRSSYGTGNKSDASGFFLFNSMI